MAMEMILSLLVIFSMMWEFEGRNVDTGAENVQPKAPPTPVPPSGVIRLMPADEPGRGRAEMLVNGDWGTICDKWFHPKGWPQSFCRQLGFPGSLVVDYVDNVDVRFRADEDAPISRHSPHFCPDSSQIPLDLCEVHEKGQCNHTFDIYLQCAPKVRCAPDTIKNTNHEGSTFTSCVPELYRKNGWGHICDSNSANYHWTNADVSWAWAFCREMGKPFLQDLHRVKNALPEYTHEDPFSMRNPNCQIAEGKTHVSNLDRCRSTEGGEGCGPDEEYYITCADSGIQQGKVRCACGQVEQSYDSQGVKQLACIPELFRSNTWGRICDLTLPVDHWEHPDKSWVWTFCRQMGFPVLLDLQRAVDALPVFSNSLPRTLMNPQCEVPAGEFEVTSLEQCDSNLDGDGCNSQEEYYITCASYGVVNGIVRCASGYTFDTTNSTTRQVACVPEFYRSDIWGRICDTKGAADPDALQANKSSWVWAFCRELGFPVVIDVEPVTALYNNYGHDLPHSLMNPICEPTDKESIYPLDQCEDDRDEKDCSASEELFVTCAMAPDISQLLEPHE